MLLAAVQATRDERRYESAMLRTLGASRGVVFKGVAAEFTALGLLSGILAAAGRYALRHHVDRLSEDHERARRFAAALSEAVPGTVDPRDVETNIVMLDVGVLGRRAVDVVAALAARSVRTYAAGPARVRCVWHLDVDDAATDHAITAACEVLSGR